MGKRHDQKELERRGEAGTNKQEFGGDKRNARGGRGRNNNNNQKEKKKKDKKKKKR